jgi:thiol-disulfide isomerase/thioredoxin
MRLTIDTLFLKYSKINSESYWVLWNLFHNVQRDDFSKVQYKTFINLNKNLRETYTGVMLKKLFDNKKNIPIGSIFPIITLSDTLNSITRIDSNLFAKFTLIDFWFSHCGPCIVQFPELKGLYERFTREDFQIIGISIDKKSDKTDFLKIIRKESLTWPQYWDIDNLQTKKMGITSFPFNLLLNKKGEILAKDLTINQIEEYLREVRN